MCLKIEEVTAFPYKKWEFCFYQAEVEIFLLSIRTVIDLQRSSTLYGSTHHPTHSKKGFLEYIEKKVKNIKFPKRYFKHTYASNVHRLKITEANSEAEWLAPLSAKHILDIGRIEMNNAPLIRIAYC